MKLPPHAQQLYHTMSDIESIVYVNPEVYIYQIPPLKDIAGYKSSEWNVDTPLWKGRLTVVEVENEQRETWCEVRLDDASTGEHFATAPYNSQGKGVVAVLDSTRFFAIRVVNGSQTAVLGLGFADRNQAFEFNVALQDFRKHSAPLDDTVKPRDYSLKEGEQIHINWGHTTGSSTSSLGPEPEAPPLIPPPPRPHHTDHPNQEKERPEGSLEHRSEKNSESEQKPRSDPFDDDFGDFVG